MVEVCRRRAGLVMRVLFSPHRVREHSRGARDTQSSQREQEFVVRDVGGEFQIRGKPQFWPVENADLALSVRVCPLAS